MKEKEIEAQAQAILSGDRRALARSITLIESQKPEHRTEAEELLRRLLHYSGKAVRIGISGVPGAGKSTFIESFGLHALKMGKKVAVLAIDPSSPRSGGSILGDKTRMEMLAREADVFIRPSPSGGTLGGVARRTREAMMLCEAAGFNFIIVETVGVGQSEVAVASMTDMFLLLLAPGAGDDLQGIKKGIVELADAVIITKADGDLKTAATRAAKDYKNALNLLRSSTAAWVPPVIQVSAKNNKGIFEVWKEVDRFYSLITMNGKLSEKRADQACSWFWDEISDTVMSTLRAHPEIEQLERQVMQGEYTPAAAARLILKKTNLWQQLKSQAQEGGEMQNIADSTLKKEFLRLYGHLQRFRKELASISQPGVTSPEDHFTSMADQLDAIVESTEEATNQIMEAMETAGNMVMEIREMIAQAEVNERLDIIEEKINAVFEACSFQDLTGQRITKVVRSLKFIEDRVNNMISMWGKDELEEAVDELKSELKTIEIDPDHALLHGPQRKGDGVTQAEVDDLFSQNEIDKLFG